MRAAICSPAVVPIMIGRFECWFKQRDESILNEAVRVHRQYFVRQEAPEQAA
jgi:hypothetical protein